MPAPASVAVTTCSNPPVASTPTATAGTDLSRFISSSNPSASRETTNFSPPGRVCTSSLSLETSIPTKRASIASLPCKIGLRLRPLRLFGFDGTADDDRRSPTGFAAQDDIGLSSATAVPILADAAKTDLQGQKKMRRPLRNSLPPDA